MKIRIENFTVAMKFPPRTELSVPNAIKVVDELWKFIRKNCKEILVTKMSLEQVLFHKIPHIFRFKSFFVVLTAAYSIKILHYNARIESGIAMFDVITDTK